MDTAATIQAEDLAALLDGDGNDWDNVLETGVDLELTSGAGTSHPQMPSDEAHPRSPLSEGAASECNVLSPDRLTDFAHLDDFVGGIMWDVGPDCGGMGVFNFEDADGCRAESKRKAVSQEAKDTRAKKRRASRRADKIKDPTPKPPAEKPAWQSMCFAWTTKETQPAQDSTTTNTMPSTPTTPKVR